MQQVKVTSTIQTLHSSALLYVINLHSWVAAILAEASLYRKLVQLNLYPVTETPTERDNERSLFLMTDKEKVKVIATKIRQEINNQTDFIFMLATTCK